MEYIHRAYACTVTQPKGPESKKKQASVQQLGHWAHCLQILLTATNAAAIPCQRLQQGMSEARGSTWMLQTAAPKRGGEEKKS